MNDRANFGPGDDTLRAMYERMLLIRKMEERLRDDAAAGNLPGAVHLYIGQEAIATGVCNHLTDQDMITSTHRGHGHFLAKGGEPRAMMAEIWGKKTGICQGMGGSMHVADVSKGILGANGIVGAGLGIATGAGYSAKLSQDGRVAACFFGDGAANEGAFMESLNMAARWQLPVVYVCENNSYSELTPSHTVTAGKLIDRAKAFGMPTYDVDGNDVAEVWQAAGEAIERARKDGGPSFIEAHTYRWRGHIEAEERFTAGQKYREESEVDEWIKKCPISRLRTRLIEADAANEGTVQEIETRIADTVEEAADFAAKSEAADPDLAYSVMFVDQRP